MYVCMHLYLPNYLYLWFVLLRFNTLIYGPYFVSLHNELHGVETFMQCIFTELIKTFTTKIALPCTSGNNTKRRL